MGVALGGVGDHVREVRVAPHEAGLRARGTRGGGCRRVRGRVRGDGSGGEEMAQCWGRKMRGGGVEENLLIQSELCIGRTI